MKRAGYVGTVAALLCSATPALAGDEPLYQAVPSWVEAVPMDEISLTGGNPLLILDTQKRLEGGTVYDYRDAAFRIDSPAALTAAGTLSAAWIPDKGDLIINRVQILRGDQVVDVIADGARFTVLRREQALERREIDGLLTATLAVPGLRVGDVLRLSFTSVQADQALGKRVQTLEVLPSAPFQGQFARTVVSWPADEPMKWQAGPEVDAPEPVLRDGYRFVEFDGPLPKRDEMPHDAPSRFGMQPLLQVGSFTSWEDVSRSMAPLFATEGTIAPDSDVMKEVRSIEAASSDPLERAAGALRVVQEQVSYLANGLDGGNYIPQSPQETWQARYGDCKAKSMLLLAMLREMGIEAEAVLVRSGGGDAVPTLLPMPADFDHMIVHATIEGKDYWLDGTSLGARLATIGDVPFFRYALPLREDGAGLLPIEWRPHEEPTRFVRLKLDETAGIDLPALFDARMDISGAGGASVRLVASQAGEDDQEDFVQSLFQDILGDTSILSFALTYDEEAGIGRVEAKGLRSTFWKFDRARGEHAVPGLPTGQFQFAPDRARAAWKDIPVQTPGNVRLRTELEIDLPDGGKGYELRGRDMQGKVAGVTVERKSVLAGDTLNVVENAEYAFDEIAPKDVSVEKAKAARYATSLPSLRAPADAMRRWELTGDRRKRLAPLEKAYAELIEKDPDDVLNHINRAEFRRLTLDWKGALEDYDAAIAIEPSKDLYFARAQVLIQLGRSEDALADLREGFAADPTAVNALGEAQGLAMLGRYDEALDIVAGYEDDSENRNAVLMTKADILGRSGAAEDGLDILRGLLAERPGDPAILNNMCWLMGTRQVGEDEMAALCTKAVESAAWSPAALDSRAMAYFRLGRLPDALADLDAALGAAPDLAPSRLLRGVIKLRMGDPGGKTDIDQALRMVPSLAQDYAQYGIELPR